MLKLPVTNPKIWFKTFYCPCCGEKLKVVKSIQNIRQSRQTSLTIPLSVDVADEVSMFSCPKCNYYTNIECQLIVRKKQQRLRTKILDEKEWKSFVFKKIDDKNSGGLSQADEATVPDEKIQIEDEAIANLIKKQTMEATSEILKMRWLLLIPVIGSIICLIKIFGGYLKDHTEDMDLRNVLWASVLIFLGVALATKLILPEFDPNLIYEYRMILVFVPASFLFNVPTLFYINKRFKH